MTPECAISRVGRPAIASGLLLRDDDSLGLLDSAASGPLKNGIGGAAQEMISLHANMTEMNWATPGAGTCNVQETCLREHIALASWATEVNLHHCNADLLAFRGL